MLGLEARGRPREDGLEVGAEPSGIVGMDAIEPFARERQKGRFLEAEHRAPPRREIAAIAHEVPIPQTVVGGKRGKRVPLLALSKRVPRALKLVVEARHFQRASCAGASLPDEPPQ
jgi:hypothetical protein